MIISVQILYVRRYIGTEGNRSVREFIDRQNAVRWKKGNFLFEQKGSHKEEEIK